MTQTTPNFEDALNVSRLLDLRLPDITRELLRPETFHPNSTETTKAF